MLVNTLIAVLLFVAIRSTFRRQLEEHRRDIKEMLNIAVRGLDETSSKDWDHYHADLCSQLREISRDVLSIGDWIVPSRKDARPEA